VDIKFLNNLFILKSVVKF